MRKLLLLAALVLPLALASQNVAARGSKAIDYDETERRRDGLIYALGADAPLTGLVREVYSRKKKKSEVHYVDGQRDGLTTRWWPNGEMRFSGSFEDGRPDGLRTDWYQNGNKKYERTLEKGVENGLATTWHENGIKETEDVRVQGKKEQEGPVTKWNDKGQVVLEGFYQSGKFTGEMTTWLGNGQAFVDMKYVDGKRTEYGENVTKGHANGQIRGEQRWIHGIRQETFWYANGQKERFSTVGFETEYGQLTEWYEDGQIRSNFKAGYGVKEGPVTDWFENGQKKSEWNAFHGKNHGVATVWFNDGSIKSKIEYVNGRRVGPTGELLEPMPPKNTIVAEPSADVTYTMHTGNLRFWNTAIQSVSAGTISGNTAVVPPGASVQMTGNWQAGPPTNSNCPSCNVQIYVAWVPDASIRGAWPPNEFLWKGQARAVKQDSEPGGTFDWTTQAPTLPGVYYVGSGQTKGFTFYRLAEGELGTPTAGPATAEAASFRIEVRGSEAKN